MPDISPATPLILEISLRAVVDNYRIIRDRTKADVACVLKANAYGLGVAPVFEALRLEGCRHFIVATPDEALQLRLFNTDVRISVLEGVYGGCESVYAENNLNPVLNSIEEMERWSAFAKKTGRKLPATLHFDTGMNRLGIVEEDRHKIDNTALTEPLDIHTVMSHFSCSDEKGNSLNDRQAQRFAEIARSFPHAKKSLCNSSGIFRDEAWHYEEVRTGYALYGGNPTPEAANPMKPVVSVRSRILQIHSARKGESAGYGASHVFDKDTQCAVVSFGYADGFFRSAGNRAKFYWNGQPCPVIGRVSMDLAIVDIGHLSQKPKAGDWMEVIGPHQDIDALAADCGTIGYEILTLLGRRYQRLYQS